MRKPSTLWHLENYSFTYNNEDRLVLQLVFRQCGLNRIMMNKLHVIQIPVFNHPLQAVNKAMEKAILRFQIKQHLVYDPKTEIIFSRVQMPKFWVFDKDHKLIEVFYGEKDATRFCEDNSGRDNQYRIWKLENYRFDYRGKPMSVTLGRDDEDYKLIRDLPFLNFKECRFKKEIIRGLNDCRENGGNRTISHKKLVFALQDSGYKLLRWWVFNSQMQPGSCHVSRDELINRLRESPCM